MNNIKRIATHQYRPMTDGVTCFDTVDVGTTYYEVVNPHWIASLDARGIKGMDALKVWAERNMDHDGVYVSFEDGKYILKAIDL